MTVRLNYNFLKDEWVRRDECKEFLDFTLKRQTYPMYHLSGAISTNSHTFCPPFKCEDGTEWCIFHVELLNKDQQHNGNAYRMVISAVDDEVFERFFHTLDEVYQFLDLFKDGDLTLDMANKYLIAW